MKNISITIEPNELFTSINLQKIGRGQSGQLQPLLNILRVQHRTYTFNLELERILLNRILIDSIKYN